MAFSDIFPLTYVLNVLLQNRSYLESESEKDMPAIMQLRLHFAHFLYKMITSVSGKSTSPYFLFLRPNLYIAVTLNSSSRKLAEIAEISTIPTQTAK